jgi:uncharacterized peroxidase-related enzyme
MAFIRTIPPAEAQGPVAEMYRQVEGQNGYVPNWARVFSLRPAVREAWSGLLQSIRANLPLRTYELATLAAARALRSTYCSLAHGSVLASKVFDPGAVQSIVAGGPESPLDAGERAVMAFAAKIALHADQVTAGDIDGLRAQGLSDEAIFDVAATAAARCFFSKLLDALGVQADAAYRTSVEPALREALTVGLPVAET